MRIVWLSHTGDLGGGAERCYWEGIQGVVSRNHSVHAILPWRGDLADKLASINVPISVIPFTWWASAVLPFHIRARRLIYNIRLAWNELSKILSESRPDLVVTNTLTIPVGALAAYLNHIPHVWCIHEFGREDHNLRFDLGARLSVLLIGKLSKITTVNSIAVQEKFAKWIPRDKLRLVYYAVEVPDQVDQCNLTKQELSLILVGRITQEKRQEDAIVAMSLLSSKGLKVRLTLVGTGGQAYEEYLKALSSNLGISDRIIFRGFTQNPFAYVAASDVALICSQNEAFGRVTVEAMKLGKPVIGANSGGTTELIRDGINGFLYQVGDPEDLARKIAILCENPTYISKMGRNGKEWANRQFNLESHTANLLGAFEEALCR